MTKTVGAVIIAKEGGATIGACLSSLASLDQVVVYDTGSTDGTPEIAKKAGADVVLGYSDEPFHFAKARNRAQRRCRTDWTLTIDCDERLMGESAEAVRGAGRGGINAHNATISDGRVPFRTVRLFRSSDYRWRYRIHERLFPNGVPVRVGDLPGFEIFHQPHGERRAWRRAQSFDLMRLALEETPEHYTLHRHLSIVYFQDGDFDKAGESATRFLQEAVKREVHPADLSEGLSMAARIMLKKGLLENAVETYEEAWRVCPDRREPLWEEAHALGEVGRYEQAGEVLERLLAIPMERRPAYNFGNDKAWSDIPGRLLEWCRSAGRTEKVHD